MSAGHAYELPIGQPALDGALAEVEAGEIAYLTRAGEPVAALVPLPHLEELWDASDEAAIAHVRDLRSRSGPLVPHEIVEAMMAADAETHAAMETALAAHPGEKLSPDEIAALWKKISQRL